MEASGRGRLGRMEPGEPSSHKDRPTTRDMCLRLPRHTRGKEGIEGCRHQGQWVCMEAAGQAGVLGPRPKSCSAGHWAQMASCLLPRVTREEAETQRLTYVPRTARQKERNQTEEALRAAVPTPSRLPQYSTRPGPVTWDGNASERVKEGYTQIRQEESSKASSDFRNHFPLKQKEEHTLSTSLHRPLR